jgi:hypothetical protein
MFTQVLLHLVGDKDVVGIAQRELEGQQAAVPRPDRRLVGPLRHEVGAPVEHADPHPRPSGVAGAVGDGLAVGRPAGVEDAPRRVDVANRLPVQHVDDVELVLALEGDSIAAGGERGVAHRTAPVLQPGPRLLVVDGDGVDVPVGAGAVVEALAVGRPLGVGALDQEAGVGAAGLDHPDRLVIDGVGRGWPDIGDEAAVGRPGRVLGAVDEGRARAARQHHHVDPLSCGDAAHRQASAIGREGRARRAHRHPPEAGRLRLVRPGGGDDDQQGKHPEPHHRWPRTSCASPSICSRVSLWPNLGIFERSPYSSGRLGSSMILMTCSSEPRR